MVRIITEEQKKINEVRGLYASQSKKEYNYSIDDFFLEPTYKGSIVFKWKHKDWKTWMKGTYGTIETQKIIMKYIIECNKPYGNRDLSFVHLYND